MGWIAYVMVAGGVLLIWAGFQDVTLTEVMSDVLNGKPLPKNTTDGHIKEAQ